MPRKDPAARREWQRAYLSDPAQLARQRECQRNYNAKRREDPEYVEGERVRKRIASRKSRSVNPAAARERDRAYRYRITVEHLRSVLAIGRCEICGATQPGGHGEWHVDHEHVTGVVRGLLCHGCNCGLGHFKDDPAILLAAASYVRERSLAPLLTPECM